MSDNVDLLIKLYKSRSEKIIDINLEEIVEMMVISQINIDFNIEAIKAQAVVARTQLVRNFEFNGYKDEKRDREYDIDDRELNIHMIDNEYLRKLWNDNYENYYNKIKKVMNETEGLIVTSNNKPIEVEFHHTCGGATENSENIMGNKVTYLRRVLCDYCKDSPHFVGKMDFLLEEIEEKLNVKFPKLTPNSKTEILGFIEDIERDETGRVLNVKIGGKIFKGKEVMDLLGLDSTRFSVSPPTISFNTSGKGYGLGLCQYGAKEMAIKGYSFREIIDYYFTGVEIKKYEKPCIEKPLSGKIIIIDPAHGGDSCHDAIGLSGLREKDINLKIGKSLFKYLIDLGAIVYLTRDEDVYLSLNNRALFADSYNPDFFISLGFNTFPNQSINGCEIYHYRGDADSEALGKMIMERMVENLDVVNRGVRRADFFLLREIRSSSLQIYVDYITNPIIEEKLKDDDYINMIAFSIGSGIVDYYKY